MNKSLNVRIGDGEVRNLSVDGFENDTLLDWLKSVGIQLNSRCGGKGRCRGCLVELESGEQLQRFRSCERRVHELEAGSFLNIPDRSLHDRSLSGITEFALLAARGAYNERDGFGLAIDIGTTTVAVALWDFSNGECLGCSSTANGQIPFGDNVVSRIQYSLDHSDGLARLRSAIWQGTIRGLVGSLCLTHGVGISDVSKVVMAGNPVMLNILRGESLVGFSRYPFGKEGLDACEILSNEEEFGQAGIPIRFMGSLAPFVGADITAGLLAAGLDRTSENVLFIDFGTNGEIVLKAGDRFLVTATAAGPAFEGGNLSCGATARDGVVSSIELIDGDWSLDLVGKGKKPKGISGAAYVDFLAEGRRSSLLNGFGRMDRTNSLGIKAGIENEYRVELGGGMYISEVDIAEILQAKAAIAGGVLCLLERAGIEEGQIDRVYLAGGFGVHMNRENAKAIGLLPAVPSRLIEVLGNASLGGASLTLLYPEFESNESALLERVETVELNLEESFEDHYTDSLMLD